MIDPKTDRTADCECQTWARDGQKFITKHSKMCYYYDPEGDARKLIDDLLDGMNAWASDEDGIHPDAWQAYKRASFAVGRLVKEQP